MPKYISLENTSLAGYPLLRRIIEKILCISQLSQMEDNFHDIQDPLLLIESMLEQLNVHFDGSEECLSKIPKTGSVIITSNHPFGGIDAAILCFLCLKARTDSKVLANYLLSDFTPFAPIIINLDPFTKDKRASCNLKGLKEATNWLNNGHLLATFPSGTVSHWQTRKLCVTDSKWHPMIARLAEHSGATVVPFYFHGQNNWYFQLAGILSSYLRTLLLPQQLLAKRNDKISISIGQHMPPVHYKNLGSPEEKIHYFRNRCYMLKYAAINAVVIDKLTTPIAPAEDINKILKELQELPASACLVEQGGIKAYLVDANTIPTILQEIGRLREITFRDSGEGSANPADLDEFDKHYKQLFLWHNKDKKIIGGYRLGLTDKIIPIYGKAGLYISTLYTLQDAFIDAIQPGIELGRSFVIKEYQRKPISLFLLWKGIVTFVAKHPKYISMYGAVSISQSFQKITRDLIAGFLQKYHMDPKLALLVSAKYPYVFPKQIPSVLKGLITQSSDLDCLDEWIRSLEYDRKGLPILFKHYHAMQTKVFGFNLDSKFNNTLDCMMMTYIDNIPARKMEFYMGKELYANYTARGHNLKF